MAKRTFALLLAGAVVCLAAAARGEEGRAQDQPTTEQGTTTQEPATESLPPPAAGEERLKEVLVEAAKPMSAASSEEIRARDFEERPHSTLIQILNNLPGLVVAQHQGGSKAPQWFLRGFDADHGTDVAVSVDGLPINMVTHAHG